MKKDPSFIAENSGSLIRLVVCALRGQFKEMMSEWDRREWREG